MYFCGSSCYAMYGLLSIVSHHSVFKYFVIKIISTNPVKPMMFFFLLKGENDFLQPRESLATARANRKKSKPASTTYQQAHLGLRDTTNVVPPEKVRWNDS